MPGGRGLRSPQQRGVAVGLGRSDGLGCGPHAGGDGFLRRAGHHSLLAVRGLWIGVEGEVGAGAAEVIFFPPRDDMRQHTSAALRSVREVRV